MANNDNEIKIDPKLLEGYSRQMNSFEDVTVSKTLASRDNKSTIPANATIQKIFAEQNSLYSDLAKAAAKEASNWEQIAACFKTNDSNMIK